MQQKILSLGKKSVLDILSRCYNKQGLSNIVDNMIEAMKASDEMCVDFMQKCYNEDHFDSLFTVILECPDIGTRIAVANLLKFLVHRLKQIEKDRLYEEEEEEIEVLTFENTVEKRKRSVSKALSARFIVKCIENLNGFIAKNWSRFDNLLDVLNVFAVGDEQLNKYYTEE